MLRARGALPAVKPSYIASNMRPGVPAMTSEFPARLTEGYRDFLAGRMATERERYREFSRRGQSPAIMVIGCCHSRASPEVLFAAHPRQPFLVSNIANLVPPYSFHGPSPAVSVP